MRTRSRILAYFCLAWLALFAKSVQRCGVAEAFVNTRPWICFSKSRRSLQTARSLTKGSATSLDMKAMAPPAYPVRVAVMGGGNFGLAMASICARKGHPTTILVRSDDVVDEINIKHTHPRYMQGITLPTKLRATSKPEECLPDATYIIHAVPCQYSRKFLEGVKDYIPAGTPVLSVSKGIENASLGFMADILKSVLGKDRPIAFLSGPSFAREIIEGVATAVVIASDDLDLARDLAFLLSDDQFKCFTSQDVIGVEIGGAVKNVIALGAGMCEGLGLGTNAMSGLVTRGCNEMRRLGLTFGARPSTIAGLSGEWTTTEICMCFVSHAMYLNCRFLPPSTLQFRSWGYLWNVFWTAISKSKVWLSPWTR